MPPGHGDVTLTERPGSQMSEHLHQFLSRLSFKQHQVLSLSLDDLPATLHWLTLAKHS